MKKVKDVDVSPIYLRPGDTFSVSYNEETILTHPIENDMLINRVAIYEIQDQYGFKTGLCAMVGEKK